MLDDFGIELLYQFLVLQAALPQIHQQFMLFTVSHLRGLEADINQILADGAGQAALEQGKVFFSLVFGHKAQALAKACDDFLLPVHIAAADGGHITAIPAQMAPQLADFLIVHGLSSLM